MGVWSRQEAMLALWPGDWLGQLHVAPAVIALLIGPVIFLRRKGTGAHRALGGAYVLCMIAVNGSALTMYDHSGGVNLFHVFAVVSLLTVVPGVIAILMGSVQGHYFFMCWSYFGLLAAGFSQVLPRLAPEAFLGWGLNAYSAAGIITGLSGGVAALLIAWQAKRLVPRYAGEAGEAGAVSA